MAERLSREPRGRAVGRVIPLAAVGAIVGPAAAWLYEAGHLDFFRAMPLLNLWLVVLFAVVGTCAGGALVRQGRGWLGGLCVVMNTAVLALYGFLASFFAFGGSR